MATVGEDAGRPIWDAVVKREQEQREMSESCYDGWRGVVKETESQRDRYREALELLLASIEAQRIDPECCDGDCNRRAVDSSIDHARKVLEENK